MGSPVRPWPDPPVHNISHLRPAHTVAEGRRQLNICFPRAQNRKQNVSTKWLSAFQVKR